MSKLNAKNVSKRIKKRNKQIAELTNSVNKKRADMEKKDEETHKVILEQCSAIKALNEKLLALLF